MYIIFHVKYLLIIAIFAILQALLVFISKAIQFEIELEYMQIPFFIFHQVFFLTEMMHDNCFNFYYFDIVVYFIYFDILLDYSFISFVL